MYFLRRLLACTLDVAIFGGIFAPIAGFLLIHNDIYSSIALKFKIMFAIYCTLIILSFSFCEMIFKTTIGKKIFKLKINSTNGATPTVSQLFSRNLFRILDHMIFPGVIVILLTGSRQRIGDLLSKTMVVMKI